MYIIDRNKDYYDYVSHIYGVDKKVVFDRRGSARLTDLDIVGVISNWGGKYYDPIRDVSYFILEIGFVQYLIKLDNIKAVNDELFYSFKSCSMKIIHTFRNNKHYFDTPLSICRVHVKHTWTYEKGFRLVLNDNFNDIITCNHEYNFSMPILADTQITSLIDPETVWKELQNYISSLNNDKDVDIKMTDVEKAETHGFDKVTSFRHPIK